MSKLTAVQVRSLKPRQKPYTVADGGGLSAHISTSGVISWRYRYRFNGKATTLVLGKYPAMSLADAREAHQKARSILSEGLNPTAEKKNRALEARKAEDEEQEKSKNTFRAVALEWIDQQAERWSHDHAAAVLATLKRDAFPLIGDIRVDQLTPPEILKVIRRIEKRGAFEIASKVLQRISAVCRYSVQTGKAMYNPAAEMRGALKTRKVVHRAALQRDELPEFLQRLKKSDEHIITKAALMFTILTAARSGEVRFAVWSEINFDTKDWRIPAARMKMGTPHVVPLSRQAMTILEAMQAHSTGPEGLIFPGIKNNRKPLSENTMLYCMYRLGYHSRATVHGFRSVFSTMANEEGFDGDVVEKALAHQERNRVRAAYHRSEYLEQRRELMQWWADMLDNFKVNQSWSENYTPTR
ncbi:tyrosine-type recombinase/integrase [Desulforhopalus singaporensis]|uniref:Integrase n=1 Tax=Desulforhopalus singaporensis TaxID=91360 RepID=A0A1H0TUB0_9BACT|nr:tyrosine-type recombinase/integrase [Desulforhopalus singaporensis]SDP57637.1 Integrase [Desulforhopalus singaporensis]